MKINATKFFGEIAIIFIGITLSFLFDEYRESRKTEHAKAEIIRSLLSDMASKKKELTNDIVSVQQSIDLIDTCLFLAQHNMTIADPPVEKLIWSISYDYGGFETSTPSYVGLSTSGIWQQVPDTVRTMIFDLYRIEYAFVQSAILKSYDYVTHLKITYFTSHHFDFKNTTTSSIRLETVDTNLVRELTKCLKDPEFASAILLIRNERAKIILFQHVAIRHQDQVIDGLKKYLTTIS